MRKIIIACSVLAVLTQTASAEPVATLAPEGCQAFNPGQPSCSFKVTHASGTPVSGYVAAGSWVIKIKEGKKTTTIKSSSPAPTGVTSTFANGAKVSAETLSPGSFVIIGHVDQ